MHSNTFLLVQIALARRIFSCLLLFVFFVFCPNDLSVELQALESEFEKPFQTKIQTDCSASVLVVMSAR